MALNRKVGLLAGAKYKGGGPMLAWVLHRISGLGIIIFVALHVIASFLTQEMGSDVGISINIIYESIYFQLFIVFCALFHGVNGFRIIALDISFPGFHIWFLWVVKENSSFKFYSRVHFRNRIHVCAGGFIFNLSEHYWQWRIWARHCF